MVVDRKSEVFLNLINSVIDQVEAGEAIPQDADELTEEMEYVGFTLIIGPVSGEPHPFHVYGYDTHENFQLMSMDESINSFIADFINNTHDSGGPAWQTAIVRIPEEIELSSADFLYGRDAEIWAKPNLDIAGYVRPSDFKEINNEWKAEVYKLVRGVERAEGLPVKKKPQPLLEVKPSNTEVPMPDTAKEEPPVNLLKKIVPDVITILPEVITERIIPHEEEPEEKPSGKKPKEKKHSFLQALRGNKNASEDRVKTITVVPSEIAPARPTEPEEVETESFEPETFEPEEVETESFEPEEVESKSSELEEVETESFEPEAFEPEEVETESFEPEEVETESSEPEQVENESSEPEQVENESSEPEQVETESFEPEAFEPEEVETESFEPEEVETEASGPEAYVPLLIEKEEILPVMLREAKQELKNKNVSASSGSIIIYLQPPVIASYGFWYTQGRTNGYWLPESNGVDDAIDALLKDTIPDPKNHWDVCIVRMDFENESINTEFITGKHAYAWMDTDAHESKSLSQIARFDYHKSIERNKRADEKIAAMLAAAAAAEAAAASAKLEQSEED